MALPDGCRASGTRGPSRRLLPALRAGLDCAIRFADSHDRVREALLG
jgi:hypothetical protein